MKTIKTDIIPKSVTLVEVNAPKGLDLKAICIFAATGFFLDTDTYWKHKKVLKPCSTHTFDASNKLIYSEPWFQWHYSPRDINFEQALQEFTELFESIIEEQTANKKVILPLSGGLDSRTQAVALRNHPNVTTFCYSFKGGYPEHLIAEKIAKKNNFSFQSFYIDKGYLWKCINELADINQCQSDFTHPRQMAVINKIEQMGNLFSLGHWGDVLFDSFNLPQLTLEEEVAYIAKKIKVKGGLELALTLWQTWELEGNFKDYFEERLKKLLENIEIKDTNAKLRAFKSIYWAPRWTSVNAKVFNRKNKIALPYYDNRMCEFVCTVPEEYLKDRRLQIAYIKKQAPELAKITWHAHKPFNLTNYNLNRSPYNLPYRITNKIKRTFNGLIGKPHISRNWELQFVGKDNDKQLKKWLFDSDLDTLVSEKVIQQFYLNFKEKDAVTYSHPVSMLLTLALFHKKFNKESSTSSD